MPPLLTATSLTVTPSGSLTQCVAVDACAADSGLCQHICINKVRGRGSALSKTIRGQDHRISPRELRDFYSHVLLRPAR